MVKQYLDHSKAILSSEFSEYKDNKRTGIGHISLFGYQNRYDLRGGFPLLTTKKIRMESIAHELIWFLRGETNIKYLIDNGVPIWNDNAFDHNLEAMTNAGVFSSAFKKHSPEWFAAKEEYIQRIREDSEFANKWGDLGPVYGSQWVHWPKFTQIEAEGEKRILYERDQNGINQIAITLDAIRKNPTAKRYVISAWNPNEVGDMALPPCHTLFHIVTNEGNLDLQLYQRSCDMFLGVPFNIASYAMLTTILAQQLDMTPRHFIHTFGDVHFYCGAGERAFWYKNNLGELKRRVGNANIYEDYPEILNWVEKGVPPELKGKELQDHVTAILKQLSREPRSLPTLKISDKPYNELTIDDFTLKGYDPHPFIKRAMAV